MFKYEWAFDLGFHLMSKVKQMTLVEMWNLNMYSIRSVTFKAVQKGNSLHDRLSL